MSWQDEKRDAARDIIIMLYQNRMIRTFYRDNPKGWRLVSGLYSPLYIQLRPLVSFPRVFDAVSRAMARMMVEEAPRINRVVGIAMAGVPISAGIALRGAIPTGFTRKMEGVKSVDAFHQVIGQYGEHALVEGELADGDAIALVDDLVTRFNSKLVALEQVKYEVARKGLSDVECATVAVVLDREQGGAEAASSQGVDLLRLIPFKTVGLPLLKDAMESREWNVISEYLEDPDRFQSPEAQAELERISAAG